MAAQEVNLRSRTQRTKKQEKRKSPKKKKSKAPFWFLVFALIILSFIVGSMIGYGIVGDRSPLEVFDLKTWTHMYDLIFG